MARKNTPFDDEDGFITASSNPYIDGYVVLYDGHEAGFDAEGGRWKMFCSAHGTMQSETNRKRANKQLGAPEAWCRTCARLLEDRTQTRTVQVRTFQKPIDKESELRFWAKKAKNNPEKQELFERMFGVRPDAYW